MNILFITCDQQQWRTITNRSMCRTPSLDRLASSGLLFNRSYAPAPVCCPVRACWMSGAYQWHNGVHTQVHSAPSLDRDMRPGVVTYSQRLHDAGYQQGFVGKWHASYRRTPLDFGFDEIAWPSGYAPGTFDRVEALDPVPVSADGQVTFTPGRSFQWPGGEPFDLWGVYDGPIEKMSMTRLADSAVEMLNRYAAGERSWHMAVHFPEPHLPYRPHQEYMARYDPDNLPLPASYYDTFENKPYMYRREAAAWAPLSEADVREATAHYFAYTEQVDAQIGRILDALDESGQSDQTIVAFTADHGDEMGAHRMFGKGWMPHEEIYRVPMIIRVPGQTIPGTVTDHLVNTHSLPHTFLDLVGLPALPHADAPSLGALLQSPVCGDWQDVAFSAGYGCEFFFTQRMVVTPRFKYMFNGFSMDEMYDLQEDPDELYNLIDDAGHSAERSHLRSLLYEMMNRYGDPYGDVGYTNVGSEMPNMYGAPLYLPRG